MKTSWVFGLLIFFMASCSSLQAQPGNNLYTEDKKNSSQETPDIYSPGPQQDELRLDSQSADTEYANDDLVDPSLQNIIETEYPYQTVIDECWSFESSRKTESAILCWEGVLEQFPNDYEALNHLANLYGGFQGDWKSGIEYGKLAADAAPTTKDKITALISMSLAYQMMSDWESSIEILRQVTEIGENDNPKTILAYLYMAHAYKMSDRMDEACEYFKITMDLGTKTNETSIMNMKDQEKFYCP